MGVGHQVDPLAVPAQKEQELDDEGVHRDQVVHLLLENRDVEAELVGPVVEVGPVEGIFLGAEQPVEPLLGTVEGDGVFLRIALGHVLEPEMVVEMPVQERAVHVQQHGVYQVPVDGQ